MASLAEKAHARCRGGARRSDRWRIRAEGNLNPGERRIPPILKRGPRSCGFWKPCCLPPPSRSIRPRSPSACPTASIFKAALAQLQADYAPRGVNLVRVANKWTFRTAGDLSWLMTREITETRRLSRAAIEVLSIIAYHQPITRAEIEDIRGVVTSKGTLDVLLETGWDQAARPAQDAGPAADLWNH